MTEKIKRPLKATTAATKKVPDAAATESVASKPEAAITPIIVSDSSSKAEKPKKLKMRRDSFTMPESDYAHIAALKGRCLKAGISVKKSEVLRAALNCLSKLSDKALTKAITDLEAIKTGRPAKR